jgi:branched-chain amino acid transport system substrate-binding protein
MSTHLGDHRRFVHKRLLLLVLALACTSGRGAYVTFGAAGPWAEAYGAMNKRGIELAADEINARPAWRAHPLQIDFKDDRGDGVHATQIAREFVDNQSIVAVVGHVNSGAMVSAAHIYDGSLPAVATTASAPALTGISSWAFRVISSDSMNGADIARFVMSRGYRRAAILYENNPYGRGLTAAFQRAYQGQIITVDPIDEGADQNFEPFVTYFRQRTPDVVFVAGTNASGRSFLREVRRQQLKVALVGGDGWSTLSTDSANAEGVFVGAPFSAEDTSAVVRRFVDAFQQRYHSTPDGNAALAYDATMLLARAIESGAESREQVRDWLGALDSASAYSGVTGRIYFSAGGDPVGKGIVMTRIHHGALLVEGDR